MTTPFTRGAAVAIAAASIFALAGPATAEVSRTRENADPTRDVARVSGSPSTSQKKNTDVGRSYVGFLRYGDTYTLDTAFVLTRAQYPYPDSLDLLLKMQYAYTDAEGVDTLDVQTLDSAGNGTYRRTTESGTVTVWDCHDVSGWFGISMNNWYTAGDSTAWECLQGATEIEVTATLTSSHGNDIAVDRFYKGTVRMPSASGWRTKKVSDPKNDASYSSWGYEEFAEIESMTSTYDADTDRVRLRVDVEKLSTTARQPRQWVEFHSQDEGSRQIRGTFTFPGSGGKKSTSTVNGGSCPDVKVRLERSAAAATISFPAQCVHKAREFHPIVTVRAKDGATEHSQDQAWDDEYGIALQ